MSGPSPGMQAKKELREHGSRVVTRMDGLLDYWLTGPGS